MEVQPKKTDRFIFTVPNYEEGYEEEIISRLRLEPNVRYAIVGIKKCSWNWKWHICGFIFLKEHRTVEWMKLIFHANFEVAKNPYDCIDYCKSFGEYHETGQF